MLLLIGNSPSSGSTLLADLFDALPGYCCGPESRFFCYRELYTDYSRFSSKLNHRFAFALPSLQNLRGSYSSSQRVLDAYGFTKHTIPDQARSSKNAPEFVEGLQKTYFQSRNVKNEVWVEKYPENIFVAADFLDTFPEAHFVQVIRDPLFVYNSLRNNRGFPPALAIATWLMASSVGYSLREHPRLITIQYEDLVKDPFATMGALAGKIRGESYAPEVIRENYEHNHYRKNSEFRNRNWTAATYGVIKNANDVEISSETLSEYHSFGGISISEGYRKLFNLPDVSIEEICHHNGFHPPERRFNNKTDLSSQSKFLVKYLFDLLYGTAGLQHLPYYLNPLKSH